MLKIQIKKTVYLPIKEAIHSKEKNGSHSFEAQPKKIEEIK